ncbi:MAG: hypothetical protein AVDCRST_MAG93-4519 [uncultured Chloroflexia bacterium]|uniref:Uncharacterized protein n=1 Tax=uncultured Chloroflexia bacterium TaxID=1672391 RepID=A0A6J4KBE3_9CHLR|nr:MAG: hypothetical protein AVDCRST_MAG93-4519 [uncultured Chloroflexia bacterium]
MSSRPVSSRRRWSRQQRGHLGYQRPPGYSSYLPARMLHERATCGLAGGKKGRPTFWKEAELAGEYS